MRWTVFFASLLLAVSLGEQQQIPGVDDGTLTDLFGKPPDEGALPDVTDNEGEPVDEDDGECQCVPFYQCNNGTINVYGENVIDIRGLNNCPDTLKRCCFEPDRVKGTEPPPTSEVLPAALGCGVRHEQGVTFKITGDTEGEAQFGEFPWMLALMIMEDISPVYKCGGSLIHPKVMLTAAHCANTEDLTQLKVRAGEWDTQSVSEPYAYQERGVDRVIKHADFYAGDLRNDIALMILVSEFDLELHINTVCLPHQGQNLDNSRCLASGWGKENFGKASYFMNILKSIELPIMPRDKCTKSFRKTRLGQFFKLHASFICAGGEKGKDTCKGDGGGPLACPVWSHEETRYVQAGIVAWGIGCGEQGVPGAYASVAHFRNWIDDKMNQEGFGTESYSLN